MKLPRGRLRRRFPAARLALCAILVAVATVGMPTASRACGGAVHHEIVDMAYDALDKQAYPGLAAWLVTYPGAADAGAVFPDWGYGMPFDKEYWDGLADLAHTVEFQNAYLEHVREAFRHPGSEDDLRTITFLFGVIAHNEADNPWHYDSDGVQSFLNAAMQIDGNDHTSVEFGTDLFAIFEYGQGGAEAAWWFPVGAVQAAYSAIGHEVPTDGLIEGMLLLATAHEAEKLAGYFVYLAYVVDLSWSHANLLTYELGGMQDGAGETVFGWQQAWDELSTYRIFLPVLHLNSGGSGDSRLQRPAGPTANVNRPISDELRRSGDAEHAARLMLLARQLLEEGAVRTHWRVENGNLIIERVEILDYQRLEELARHLLGVPGDPSFR
jgi:hypothetical protein